MKIILASSSPRRRQLLALAGQPFTVQPASVDETQSPGEHPRAYVLRLAREKARAVAAQAADGALIFAADTTVVDGEQIMGKPAHDHEARQMLLALRGRTHQVITGIAVLECSSGQLLTDWCLTDVSMRAYSEEELNEYIQTGDPLDKAGAYAIQHAGFHPVHELNGCYANVVGMPLCHLTRTLRKLSLHLSQALPALCQAQIAYQCPVYQQILQ